MIVVAGLLTAGGWAAGQDAGAPKTKRTVVALKYTPAKELVVALSKHFKGELEIHAVPGQGGNFLLVSGPAALVDELSATLQTIDRQPATLSVEILLIDGKPGAGDNQFDEQELTGPTNRVQARLQAMKSRNQLGGIRTLHLTAVENVKTTTTYGESRPFVTGLPKPKPAGKVGVIGAMLIEYRQVGTKVTLTPHLSEGKLVAIELELEDSRVFTPPDGIEIGTDGKGVPVTAAEFSVAQASGRIVVPFDQYTVVKGLKVTTVKGRQTQAVALVCVRLIDANGK
jgi:type II secretory pathway component GspD/PulD (secretin)